jgi:hypothetical protein
MFLSFNKQYLDQNETDAATFDGTLAARTNTRHGENACTKIK